MRTICIISLLFLIVISGRAQQTKRFTPSKIQLEVDYRHFFGQKETYKSSNLSHTDNLKGNSLRLSVLYTLTPLLQTGIGCGLDRYESPGSNTLPLFIAFRYVPLSKFTNPYIFTNIGYSFKNANFDEGVLWEAGIGYKYMFKKHFGIKLEAGYNLRTFKYSKINPNYMDATRHSLLLGIGIII